ncbi:unnamed protein product [Gongylonema pulchrum]|uniref:Uncharacterized protein n=1 Tax=Gongylonema pulchrum TaxID=637853 RepID=A0A183CZ71_9BILA|nr:unnamed protein product [Gongylonema pulchrum]
MSESEKERIEVENRRRRIRRTAKLHRLQHPNNHHYHASEDESDRKAALAHRLRAQMQRALRKTAEELKEGERQKHQEYERARRLREERLYEQSLEMRRRYVLNVKKLWLSTEDGETDCHPPTNVASSGQASSFPDHMAPS